MERLVVIDIGPDNLATSWATHELPAMLGAVAVASYADPQEAVDEWLAGDPLARDPVPRHYVDLSTVVTAPARPACTMWRAAVRAVQAGRARGMVGFRGAPGSLVGMVGD